MGGHREERAMIGMEERNEDCQEREREEGKVADHKRSVNVKVVTNETVKRARVTAMFTHKQELKIVIVSEGPVSFLCQRRYRLLCSRERHLGKNFGLEYEQMV